MRPKHKNQIFEHLKNSKLGIDNFNITSESKKLIIEYKNSRFQFIITNYNNGINDYSIDYTKYTLNFAFINDLYPHFVPCTIENILESIDYWINNEILEYLEDQETNDLLEEYLKNKNLTDNYPINFDSTEEFSIEEKNQLILSMNEFKTAVINELKANNEEQKIINSKLDYLIEAVNNQNKFDWKGIAINTLISISTKLALDSVNIIILRDLFEKAINIVPLLGN